MICGCSCTGDDGFSTEKFDGVGAADVSQGKDGLSKDGSVQGSDKPSFLPEPPANSVVFTVRKPGKMTGRKATRYIKFTQETLEIHKAADCSDDAEQLPLGVDKGKVKVLGRQKNTEFCRVLLVERGSTVVIKFAYNKDKNEKDWETLKRFLVQTSKSEAGSPEKAEGRDNEPCPSFPYSSHLTTSFSAAYENCLANLSSDPSGWNQAYSSASKSGTVSTVEYQKRKGTKALRFRSTTTMPASVEQVGVASNTYPLRCDWDSNLNDGRIIQAFPSTPFNEWTKSRFIFLSYSTLPALGGAISPRYFLEVRWCGETEDGHKSMFITFNVNKAKGGGWKEFEEEERRAKGEGTRAKNLEGCQYLEALENGITKMVMLSVSEVGGMLPVGAVNKATGKSLIDSMESLGSFVTKDGSASNDKGKGDGGNGFDVEL